MDFFLIIFLVWSFAHISLINGLLTKAASLVLIHVCNQVNEVDGEPGEAEDNHHGNHHLVHLTGIRIVNSQQSASMLTSLLWTVTLLVCSSW